MALFPSFRRGSKYGMVGRRTLQLSDGNLFDSLGNFGGGRMRRFAMVFCCKLLGGEGEPFVI